MTLRPIVTLGDPRLRMVGTPITSFGATLHELLDDMTQTMRDAPGVGIAAQQVGEALQLCVIEVDGELYEVANPEIVHLSGEQEDYEGCLSVPGFVGVRKRADHAVMIGQDRDGKRIRIAGSGLLARAIQHEYDHLQGTLYLDALDPAALIPASRLDEDEDEDESPEAARLRERRRARRAAKASIDAATEAADAATGA
ncbi:MAG: peptide deformylase [Chloroflexi bacterium]|nr:peptide deformylase [Chloroflexota bacterium]